MVSLIAKKIANKRQHKGIEIEFWILIKFIPALCDVFDKADITRDGTISIAEYMALCEEFGVRLNENDIEAVKNITDEEGEVDFEQKICMKENVFIFRSIRMISFSI